MPILRAAAARPGASFRLTLSTPVLATVRLVNAVFYAHHGVMAEEHVVGGRFEVDVAMTLDVAEAAETDSLDRTVDYERVYRIAQEVVTGATAFLIERLAWGIATAVREAYPTLERVEVTVRKPNPPVGGPCDRAEVSLALGPA